MKLLFVFALICVSSASSADEVGFSMAELREISSLVPPQKAVNAYVAIKPSAFEPVRQYLKSMLESHGQMSGDLGVQTYPHNFASVTYFRVPLSGSEILEIRRQKGVIGIAISKADLELFGIRIDRPSVAKVSEDLEDLLSFALTNERFRAVVMLNKAWDALDEGTKNKIKTSGVEVLDLGPGGTYFLADTTLAAIKALGNEPSIQTFSAP